MHAEPAVAGTALRLLQRPAGPSTGPQPLWVTPPRLGEPPLPRTENWDRTVSSGANPWALPAREVVGGGVIGQGVSMLPPQGQGSKFDSSPLPHPPPLPPRPSCCPVYREIIYIYV